MFELQFTDFMLSGTSAQPSSEKLPNTHPNTPIPIA
jgi:hypothetical protein